MPGQKNYIAFGKLTGEKPVGWRAKRGFYRLPFLVAKTIDCVKAAAANNSDAVRLCAHVIFVAN